MGSRAACFGAISANCGWPPCLASGWRLILLLPRAGFGFGWHGRWRARHGRPIDLTALGALTRRHDALLLYGDRCVTIVCVSELVGKRLGACIGLRGALTAFGAQIGLACLFAPRAGVVLSDAGKLTTWLLSTRLSLR